MATLKEIEYDYEAAKKKNNRIKMTATSKLITEIKILSAKKNFSEPPQQLIDAVVIKNVRKIKTNILACPVSKSKTLKDFYKELSYITVYMPPIITNKEAIKQGIIKIADKYNILFTEENKQVKCDVAFVPVGGTYTMDFKEAASLINEIKPKIAIPTHYGSVVGTEQDAVDFVRLLHPITKGIILMK